MTLTIELWMLIPALLAIGGIVLIWIGGKQTGMLGGLFEGLAGFALIIGAILFMVGRWLA